MSLQLTLERNSIYGKDKPESGNSGSLSGPGTTDSDKDTVSLSGPLNFNKGSFMSSERFIKLVQSPKGEWLQENYPSAFLLLTVIARRARRSDDDLSGLKQGDAIIGREEGSRAAGITPNQFRTALEHLEKLGLAEVVFHPKSTKPQKRTIKITIKSLVVNLCSLDIYDVNFHVDHQPHHQQTTNKPPTNHHKQDSKERKKDKNKKIFSSDSVEFGLAAFLFSSIQKFLPTVRTPNLNRWAADLDVMIRNDSIDPSEIKKMIEWLYSRGPVFWKKNILSPSKLREKWDRLLAELQAYDESSKPKIDRRQRDEEGKIPEREALW